MSITQLQKILEIGSVTVVVAIIIIHICFIKFMKKDDE